MQDAIQVLWTLIHNKLTSSCALLIGKPAQIPYKCRSYRQNLGTRNENNTHINLFANAEAVTYTMESELHGSNLKNATY
jgi:hypothetical protein